MFRIRIDLNTDPDPDQAFEVNTDPDPAWDLDSDPGFFLTNIFKKICSKIVIFFFGHKLL